MLAATLSTLLRSATSRAASTSAAPPTARALAALCASNSSLPSLEGATLLARVLRAERGFVVVDAGLKRPVRVARSELRSDQLVSSPAGASPLREGPGDVRVGDVLRMHVDAVTTPYGDPALSSGPRVVPRVAAAEAWAALTAAHASGGTVQGRVLNGIGAGGFAVGVAGMVGFLPHSLTAPATVARVGTLQPFRVVSVDATARTFILEDVGAATRRAAADKARKEAAAAGESIDRVTGVRRPWGSTPWAARTARRAKDGEGDGARAKAPRSPRKQEGGGDQQAQRWTPRHDAAGGGDRPRRPREATAAAGEARAPRQRGPPQQARGE